MRKCFNIICCLLSVIVSHGQTKHTVDSLAAVVARLDDSDTAKVLALNSLAWDESYLDLDSGLTIVNESIELARRQGYIYGEAEALNVAGTIYADMGRYADAVDAHLQAIRLRENTPRKDKLGESYHNLALVYASMDSASVSLKYQRLAYENYRQSSDSSGIGPICNYIGESFLFMGNIDEAEKYFKEGVASAAVYKYKHWIAANTSGLAYCAAVRGDFETAERLMHEAFILAKSENNEYNMMSPWIYIAKLRRLEGKYAEAIAAVDSALLISTKLDIRDSRMLHLQLKAELLELSGDNESALEYYRQHQGLKDSILSSKNQQSIKNLEAVYEKEKTEQQLEILRQDGRLQKIYVTGGIVCSVGFVVIAFLLFGRIRMGKKAGLILVEKKAIIESKNKDITDSINYARRIQDAVTPVEQQLESIFHDSFVFNRPRSIVTGDFWWIAETDDQYFVVVGDCSGHGVPGAFMSVMAVSFLNGIVIEQKIHSPEKILFELNKKVRAALKHSGTKEEGPLVSDTIEIAICSFSKSLQNVQFSSAGMPVTIIRKHHVIEYRGSEFRAGAVSAAENPFSLNTATLEKGDQMFLFSDGILGLPGIDQKQIQDLLVSLDSEGTSAEKALDLFIREHCGKFDQPDDILVIGMKV